MDPALRSYGPTRLLAGLTTLMLVVAVGSIVVMSAFRLTAVTLGWGEDISVHQRMDAEMLEGWPTDVVQPETVAVTVRLRGKASDSLLALGRDLPVVLLFAAGLWLLRSVAHSTLDGDPFTGDNVRRLRLLGFLLLFGVPLAGIVSQLFEDALARNSSVPGLSSASSGWVIVIRISAWIAALGVFVLAQLFAHGVALRDDIEGTV